MFYCVNVNFTGRKEEGSFAAAQRDPHPAEGAGPVGGAEVLQHPVGVVFQMRGAPAVVQVARQGVAGPLAAEQRGGNLRGEPGSASSPASMQP
jgi:hypothetical protein